MGRKSQIQNLYLYMNGLRVGTLAREFTGRLVFTYHEEWLNWEDNRPISLSMPLTEIPYKGDLVENYFDNLLPDNEVIRERIQARFAAPSKRCFDLLSYIGADCAGALQLLTTEQSSYIKKITADPINDNAIANLLKDYQTAPLGMGRNQDFRISIAGAQEKTALLWHGEKWWIPFGTTPTTHIIKLPIGMIKHSGINLSESVENEWLCLQILSAYNLSVNHAEVIEFSNVKTLVVKRFDRQWSEDKRWLMRLPQEDLCQALGKPSGLKYESDGGPGIKDVMQVLLSSIEATNDREKFMTATFLYWVLGAIDGHAKNFSISIKAKGHYQLTPLYDVISAYPMAEQRQVEWKKLKMAMAVQGKNRHYTWDDIQLRHWLETAKQCYFPESKMQAIIDNIFDNMEAVIEKVTAILPADFPPHISLPIFNGMRRIRDKKATRNVAL